MKEPMTKGTTVKLQGPANELLERYLGWLHYQGQRISKEDALAQFVEDGVRAKLPAEKLKELAQADQSAQATKLRKPRQRAVSASAPA